MKKNLFIFNFKKLPAAFLITFSITIIFHLAELFVLPINFFTFRVWEALVVHSFHSELPGPFYPNMQISMIEEGDLGRHTKYAVKKRVEWQTDRYGYRKRNVNIDSYKIVIIGDSSIAGTSLTQQDMLSEVLEQRLKVPVYPLAPANIDTYFNNKRFINNPPDIVILGAIERDIWKLPVLYKHAPPSWLRRVLKPYLSKNRSLTILLDRFSKNAVQRYLGKKTKRIIEEFISNITSKPIRPHRIIQTSAGTKMFFWRGAWANIDVPEKEIDRIVQIIKVCDETFKHNGIRFIFLPIPNKENILYEYLSVKKKPVFLKQLISKLKSRDIETINTQKAFEEAYRKDNILLYHTDDSHCNANGVKLAADLIESKLREAK